MEVFKGRLGEMLSDLLMSLYGGREEALERGGRINPEYDPLVYEDEHGFVVSGCEATAIVPWEGNFVCLVDLNKERIPQEWFDHPGRYREEWVKLIRRCLGMGQI